MKKVLIFLADGFEECEALITLDLLKRAGIEVTTASIMGRKNVISTHQVEIMADTLASNVEFNNFDCVVLPGGQPGTSLLEKNATVIKVVQKFYEEGKLVAAICAAPSILGHLGILEGKKATCYPGFESELENATVTFEKSTVDENVITGQAVAGAFYFGLDIIGHLEGFEMYKKVKEEICF